MAIKKFLPLIGLVIFALIVLYVGPSNIFDSLIQANPFYLALSFALIPFIVLFQVYKWKVLLNSQNIDIAVSELTKIYLIGFFYGAITPGKLGSFIRISYLSKAANLKIGRAASSVIADRITDFVSLFFLGVFGAVLVASFFSDLFYITLASFLGLLALLWVFSGKERSAFFIKTFFQFLVPEKLKAQSSEIFHDFYDSMPSKTAIAKSQFFSFVSWIIILFHSYVITLAFSINVPWWYVFGFFSLAGIVSLLPITFNGLGTNEASLIALFSLLGVNAASVFSFSIAVLVLLTFFVAFIGFIISLSYKN